jgi:putative aldouronate transport system substrate-binding protein
MKKRHRKFALLALLALTISCTIGCGTSSDQTAIETETSQKENTDTVADTTVDGDTIIWVLPGSYCELTDLEKNESYLNELLKEDGYDFQLSILSAPDEDYAASVLNLAESDSADIIGLGLADANDVKSVPEQLYDAGILYDLSAYLDSPEGSGLSQAFYESLWDTMKMDDGTYVIPNQSFLAGTSYAAFRKDIFGDSVMCDGTVKGIMDLVDQADIPEDMTAVLWSVDLSTISLGLGYQDYNGVFISEEDGSCYFPYQTEELLEAYRLLHEKYMTGTLVDPDSSDYRNSLVTSGNVAVWVNWEWMMTRETVAEDYVFVQLPYTFSTTFSGGTGISRESTKKEEALTLLTLLYTDEKYTNALFYGEPGVDYEWDQMEVSYPSDDHGSPFIASLITGIFDLVYPGTQYDFPVNRKESKWSLYGTEAERESWTSGFLVSDMDEKAGLMDLAALTTEYQYIWQDDDFESEWEEANQKYQEMNGEEIVKTLEELIQQAN